jgi:hypothetical protein
MQDIFRSKYICGNIKNETSETAMCYGLATAVKTSFLAQIASSPDNPPIHISTLLNLFQISRSL